MRIGIILHPYDEDKPAGLARTIFEWTKALLTIDTENEYIIFVKKEPQTKPNFPGGNWQLESLGGGIFWLDSLRKKTQCDVYIFNTPVMPLFFRPKKSIVIALDFAYYYLKGSGIKNFFLKWVTFTYHKLSLVRADRIVAISEATKDDTIKLFNTPEEKIDVIYLGYKKICDVSENPVDLPQKFFFFAGIIKERKNVFNIIKAFHTFSKENPDISLVVAGNPSGAYFEKIRKYIEDNGLSSRVIFVGHMNDGQLSYIYKKALAFVFPTLIEGFGMPVLEAMDCGIPVITSNQSSLREVGGNGAALLVDPYNPEDIAQKMSYLVDSQEAKNELIKKGFTQATLFSWEKAAKNLLKVVRNTKNPQK